MGMTPGLPLARTNAEAHVYLGRQRCSTCGETECAYRSSVVRVHDVLASRYTGTCPRCGNTRVYEFRLPEQILPPPRSTVVFGGDDPSELLDPGQWLTYADDRARRVPADRSGLDGEQRRAVDHALATAAAALDEVLKFIPDGGQSVPETAFFTVYGQTVYAREPGRFNAARLKAVRDSYLRTI